MKHVKGDVKLVVAGRPWKDDFSKYDQLSFGVRIRVKE